MALADNPGRFNGTSGVIIGGTESFFTPETGKARARGKPTETQ
jgi:hypothetical protein